MHAARIGKRRPIQTACRDHFLLTWFLIPNKLKMKELFWKAWERIIHPWWTARETHTERISTSLQHLSLHKLLLCYMCEMVIARDMLKIFDSSTFHILLLVSSFDLYQWIFLEHSFELVHQERIILCSVSHCGILPLINLSHSTCTKHNFSMFSLTPFIFFNLSLWYSDPL